MESTDQFTPTPTDREKRIAYRAFPTTAKGPYYNADDIVRWRILFNKQLDKGTKDFHF